MPSKFHSHKEAQCPNITEVANINKIEEMEVIKAIEEGNTHRELKHLEMGRTNKAKVNRSKNIINNKKSSLNLTHQM